MNTEVFKENYLEAAALLNNGGLVAVPTETVYGIAGNGLDTDIIEKIYEIKGRPAYKPISLMVSGIDDIEKYTINAPRQAFELACRFWPGPLTIVLQAAQFLPKNLLAGGTTVGLRCPASPETLALIKSLDYPLAVPSANISGKPSPKNAAQVLAGMGGLIEGLIDGGECGLGFESTIIDMSRTPYRILRHGSLPDEEVYNALSDNMNIIGITGCTGAGKTTALNVLSRFGYNIIDCDSLYHELLESNKDMLNELFNAFPECEESGRLNRKKLASIVFNNQDRLLELNAITHRYIISSINDLIKEKSLCGETGLAIDAVELFSSGLGGICSFTMAVVADKEIRLQRLIDRDNITEADALQRINAQKDETYFTGLADYTVYNNSDKSQLHDSILNILLKETEQ